MQKMKRILSMLLALVMIVGAIAPLNTVLAAETDAPAATNISTAPDAVTNTVTLHKLIMTPKELSDWNSDDIQNKENGYDGTQDLAGLNQLLTGGKTVKEIANVYFAFKYKDGTNADKFVTIDATNSENPVYGVASSLDESLTGNYKLLAGKTLDTGITFNTKGLKGKFEIVEVAEKSTYKGEKQESLAGSKAVPVEITLPLVNNKGTVLNAHVYPKNTEDKPKIDKNFAKNNITNAAKYTDDDKQKFFDTYEKYMADKATMTADIGKEVPYEVKTKVKAGTEYGKLVWKDNMTNGLSLDTKNISIVAKSYDANQATGEELLNLTNNTDYKITADERGFTLALTSDGLAKVKNVTKPGQEGGKDVEFTITYSAKVNGTAVVDNPEKNDISIEYGHKPGKDIEEKTVTPNNGDLAVTKTWANGSDTNAPSGVVVTYTLKQNNETKASVTLDGTKTGTIELGNGITFEVTDKYSGTFKGLTGTEDWTFSERVAGYEPAYTETNDNGTVTVKNNKDNDNPPPISPNEPKVVVGGKKFVKTSQNDTEKLAGAKFVVKKGDKYLASKTSETKTQEQTDLENAKEELNTAVKNYNGRQDDTDEASLKQAIDSAQTKYNAAFKKASIAYAWVDAPTGGAADNRLTFSSNAKGQFEITGIEYGDYKLEEIEAPKGFAKIADIDFKVAEGASDTDVNIKYEDVDSANNAKQVINKKVTIPQTGGIGTIIFGVAGVALMGGAVVAMKRNNEEDEEVE